MLTHSALTSSIEKQLRIFKASMIRFTINVIINVSRIDNIVVNISIIVTMIDSHLIFVLVINSRFVHLKSASYVINLHADQRIISKKNARIRKSVLSIVTRHLKHVQKFERRFEQFIVDYENNDINKFIT